MGTESCNCSEKYSKKVHLISWTKRVAKMRRNQKVRCKNKTIFAYATDGKEIEMKALRFLEPGKMKVEEEPIPVLQSEDEVLVEIYYSGICKSDLELLRGTHPHLVSGNARYPIIPGHEWSGVVCETGRKVTEFQVGDRVVGDVSLGCGCCEMCKTGRFNLCPSREVIGSYGNRQGSFAQYLRTHKRSLYHVPDSLSLKEAAAVEPAATAAYTVKKSGVKYGDRVLVMGDGPIGLFAVQAAKAVGAAQVVLIGSWPEKISLALKNGADNGFSYRSGNAAELARQAVGGGQFDIVLETSGNLRSINEAISLLKPSGTIGMVSFYGGTAEINLNDVITKDATIQGVLASPNMFHPTLSAMEGGRMNAAPLITHTIGFSNMEEAFAIAESREEMSVKIVVEIKEERVR